jgi:hypothetical protein
MRGVTICLDGAMENATQARIGDICPRCKVTIKRNAPRCPHCGERLGNNTPIYMMGVAGLLALIFAGWMMFQTIRDSEKNANADGQQQTVNQPAAAPDKTPPLNK